MFELFGYFVMGWILYRLVAAWATLQEIKQAVRDAAEKDNANTHTDGQVLVVRMEPVDQGDYHVVLAYNHKTNKFLGQDSTEDQVKKMLTTQFPKMSFIFVNEKATVQAVQPAVDTKSI